MRRPDRIVGLDTIRLISLLFVIFIHAATNLHILDQAPTATLIVICQCAVPFFFVVSGYFLAGRHDADLRENIDRTLRRLLPIWLLWLALYLTIAIAKHAEHHAPLMQGSFPQIFINGGPGYHLWFMPALIVGSIVALLTAKLSGRRIYPALAVAIYCAIFSIKFGSLVWLGLASFEAEIGSLLLGIAYVALGYALGLRQPALTVASSTQIALVGLMLHFAEKMIIAREFSVSLVDSGYGFATGIVAIGLVGLGLSVGRRSHNLLLATVSRYFLGIYALHVLILEIAVSLLKPPHQLAFAVGIAVLTIIGSLFAALAIGLSRHLRWSVV